MKDDEREAYLAAWKASSRTGRSMLGLGWWAWQASAKHKRLSPDAASGGEAKPICIEEITDKQIDDEATLLAIKMPPIPARTRNMRFMFLENEFTESLHEYARAAIALNTTATGAQGEAK